MSRWSAARYRAWIACLLSLVAALSSIGCVSLPEGRYALKKLQVEGNRALDDDDIEQIIASRASPRFLGVFYGVVYDYEVFDRFVLERDLERIERYYRARGFYRARVRAARVSLKGRGAKVQIRVEEGPPVLVRRVDIHGLEALQPRAAARLRAAVGSKLPLGKPFEEEAYQNARDELSRELSNLGYAYGKAKPAADVDLPNNAASVGFWVEKGPSTAFGNVRIEGLGPLPESLVRRTLDIRPGTPYSQNELDEAKRALLDLGVFSAVNIDPELSKSPPAGDPVQVPIVVRVERAKL
ncbi:MAG TPA: POTRA domain-containing protein, partial [Polyangiaceae bacterium]|nr:POTRA domain-containing protein [Polyangiaceae bacterium]